MSHNDLCLPPIDTNVVDSWHAPDVTQRSGHALATVTAGARQGGEVDSGFGDIHCDTRLLGNRCEPMVSVARTQDARRTNLKYDDHA